MAVLLVAFLWSSCALEAVQKGRGEEGVCTRSIVCSVGAGVRFSFVRIGGYCVDDSRWSRVAAEPSFGAMAGTS